MTLVELLVATTASLIILLVIPSVLETVTMSSTQSQGVASGAGQARLAIENLSRQVGSAIDMCLPTQLSSSGYTVRILQVLNTSTNTTTGALTTTYRWDQWMVAQVSGTWQLEEEESATQTTTSAANISWPSSSGQPVWVAVAKPISQPSGVAPFSMPSSGAAGNPEQLSVDIRVAESEGTHKQYVELKSTIVGLSTPDGTSTTTTSSSSTSTTTTTVAGTSCLNASPSD
jgi:Tfp pilus assembly protein PilW